MQLLGKSLEDLFNESKTKHFSIKTTCNLGYQMINLLEFIHKKHVIHRDVKPDNFVMGLNQEQGKVYLIDFGLAKKYRSSRTLKHCPLSIFLIKNVYYLLLLSLFPFYINILFYLCLFEILIFLHFGNTSTIYILS